jgi:uncharacterized protein (DUF2267 family)
MAHSIWRWQMPSACSEARAVFRLLETHVSEGEIRQVMQTLPQDIRVLWPQAA